MDLTIPSYTVITPTRSDFNVDTEFYLTQYNGLCCTKGRPGLVIMEFSFFICRASSKTCTQAVQHFFSPAAQIQLLREVQTGAYDFKKKTTNKQQDIKKYHLGCILNPTAHTQAAAFSLTHPKCSCTLGKYIEIDRCRIFNVQFWLTICSISC